MVRTHEQVILENGGPAAFARALGVDPNNVYPWRRLSSIPGGYWLRAHKLGLTTLEELAAAAEQKLLTAKQSA